MTSEANSLNTATFASASCHKHGSFSGPAVSSIVSFNCEGYSSQKEELISDLCAKNNRSLLCLQETHRANESQAINIQGYILVSEIKHAKHGSAILVKENILTESTQAMIHDKIEFFKCHTQQTDCYLNLQTTTY